MLFRLLLFFFLLTISFYSYGQKIIISGKETSRPLVWKDFSGTPDNNSPFYALTWWNLRFRYESVEYNGNNAQLTGFQVQLELDPEKSWVKSGKETDYLLAHEQLHFNMGILCMREIIAAVNSATLKKNDYNEAIRNLFSAIMTKYKAMGNKYDEETNHGANKEQQEKWSELIAKEMAK